MPRFNGPAFHPKLLVAAAGALVVLIVIFTSYYTVDADSEGVVQRFGRYYDTVKPGLHFKWAFQNRCSKCRQQCCSGMGTERAS